MTGHAGINALPVELCVICIVPMERDGLCCESGHYKQKSINLDVDLGSAPSLILAPVYKWHEYELTAE